MIEEIQGSEFFVVGGDISPGNPSYVKRPADDKLPQLSQAGEFCYVLATRQIGKSSLRIRTAHRLEGWGIRTVQIDLNRIGTKVTTEQWYFGIFSFFLKELGLSIDLEDWWTKSTNFSPVNRFTNFLCEVVLTEIESPIVIFIDEIDATLKLDFTDDFFAAIRSIYNARSENPEFRRLTFVLLGVATPSDLIKDPDRTPFNIGQGIDLSDFGKEDIHIFQQGLEQFRPEQRQIILDRVFYWTNGHPYLTQKLCQQAAVQFVDEAWTEARIDALVQKLFFSEEAIRHETNLQFIRDSITRTPRRAQLLTLYRKVYQGKKIPEDVRSSDQNYLKLFGLVRAEHGFLQVRNEIYRQAFDLEWIKKNIPINRKLIGAIVIVALILASVGVYIWQKPQPDEVLAQDYEDNFTNTINPNMRLENLANLLELQEGKYSDQACNLFETLPREEKVALFTNASGLEMEVRAVVKSTYTDLEDTEDNNHLLATMQSALAQSVEKESVTLLNEIAHWLEGRTLAAQSNFDEAEMAYSAAIDLNGSNPGTYFDRALVHVVKNDDEQALADLEKA